MKIGMRNIKTALSVFICVAVFNLFSSDTPFYAAIAAVITTQSSVIDSFKTGRNRMLGTILGAFIGLILALIQPGNPILCALGIIMIIYLCNLFEWNKAISVASVVFIAIMVNMGTKSPVQYSLARISDTLIGITVAFLVNYFIAPPNLLDTIHSGYTSFLEEANKVLMDILCFREPVDLTKLRGELRSFQSNIDTYATELKFKAQESGEITEMRNIADSFRELYHHIKTIDSLTLIPSLNEANLNRAKELFNYEIENGYYDSDEISIVYNYHIGKIFEDLDMLKSF